MSILTSEIRDRFGRFIKGHKLWNVLQWKLRENYKHSDITKKKISESLKGHKSFRLVEKRIIKECPTCNTKFITYPSITEIQQGKFCSRNCIRKDEEMKNKISYTLKNFYIMNPKPNKKIKMKCIICEQPFLAFNYEKNTRQFCSRMCVFKYKSETSRDENNPNWKGGYKRNRYTCNIEYKKWRNMVFERDNWTCQTCQAKSSPGNPIYLEAYHIKSWKKFPELRFDTENGIALCKNCHILIRKKNGVG
ncbi:MAG: HNH endonuclease signature motif containing protein [Elusimicrobiota bacterium]